MLKTRMFFRRGKAFHTSISLENDRHLLSSPELSVGFIEDSVRNIEGQSPYFNQKNNTMMLQSQQQS